MKRLLTVLLALFVFVGCAPPPQRLMPTPSVMALGYIDPLAHVAPDRRRTTGTVFIASNRGVTSSASDSHQSLTNTRSHLLRLAVSEVTIGRGLGWDELADASRRPRHEVSPVIVVEQTEVLGVLASEELSDVGGEGWLTAPEPGDAAATDRWLELLNAELTAGAGSDVLIYVHGYNTDFHVNTGLAAEMWHFAGREGAVVSFAWPSRHRVLGFGADKANAVHAVRYLRQLLAFLADRSAADRIHILAHSAGCPIVVDAIRELRMIGSSLGRDEVRAKYRIGRVVLAAPDMDLMQFFNARLDGFHHLPERVSVYASSEDDALRLSTWLFGDERLGDSVGRLTEWEEQQMNGFVDTEIIDVTRSEDVLGGFLGHSYYHRNPWVSSDLLVTLTYGLPAHERGLVRDEGTGCWVFPDNYLHRLANLVRPLSRDAE